MLERYQKRGVMQSQSSYESVARDSRKNTYNSRKDRSNKIGGEDFVRGSKYSSTREEPAASSALGITRQV